MLSIFFYLLQQQSHYKNYRIFIHLTHNLRNTLHVIVIAHLSILSTQCTCHILVGIKSIFQLFTCSASKYSSYAFWSVCTLETRDLVSSRTTVAVLNSISSDSSVAVPEALEEDDCWIADGQFDGISSLCLESVRTADNSVHVRMCPRLRFPSFPRSSISIWICWFNSQYHFILSAWVMSGDNLFIGQYRLEKTLGTGSFGKVKRI